MESRGVVIPVCGPEEGIKIWIHPTDLDPGLDLFRPIGESLVEERLSDCILKLDDEDDGEKMKVEDSENSEDSEWFDLNDNFI